MAPSKHEQEIAQLRHERDTERKAHDQTRHQLILATNQVQSSTERERKTEADVVAARLRIEELETLETLEKGELVLEVEALKTERDGFKNKMEKLGTRVARLIIEKDAARRSRDQIKIDFDSLKEKIETTTKAASTKTSKNCGQPSEETELAEEIQKDTCPSVSAARNNRVVLLQALAHIYDAFRTTSSKVCYDEIGKIENFDRTGERWRKRRAGVATRRRNIEDNINSTRSLRVEIEEMFEDMHYLQAQLTAWKTESYGWQNRWRQRKLMHEYALEDLEICRKAAPDIAGKYWRLRRAARSPLAANDGSDKES